MMDGTVNPALSAGEGRRAVSLSLERAWNLPRYARIIQRLPNIDVSVDHAYRKDFNFFFKVRRSSTWQDLYYAELERLKFSHAEFEPVLRFLYRETGRVEASFASKLIAVIDPSMPILDSKVLSFLDLKIGGSSPDQRLAAALVAYERIVGWYSDYLGSDDATENIALFDSLLPKYSWVSDTKKIDFLLWSL